MRKLSKTDRIRILLNSGNKSPLAIAQIVRCTPSYVYRMRKEAEQKARKAKPLRRAA